MTPPVKSARSITKRYGIPTIDLIRTYLGLICLGKSDFEAVEQTRQAPFSRPLWGSSNHLHPRGCASVSMKMPAR
jgi:hypothetical protein